MVYLPIIGAFLEASGMILEKKILKSKNMNFKNYTVYEFLSIVAVSLPFLYFMWHIEPEAFEIFNMALFAFIIIVSVAANLLIFYSLKRENVTVFEPIWLMQPLFTVLLAFALYPAERDLTTLGLALLASVTLVLSHVKKSKISMSKYLVAAFAGSFLFAVELVASKPLLPYYNPFMFYFIRCFFVFAITLVLFRPKFRRIGNLNWLMIFAVGAMWIIYRAIMYYGYESYGIVLTTVVFILSPVFLFIMAALFLKEQPRWRDIISTAVIVGCVAAVLALRG